jgi:DivIVA domain-containing protein
MALTPDDLQYKEFPETKFRPGYDKDHVDDFLDEIVVQWRQLLQENEDLKSKVASLQDQYDNDPENLEPADLADAGLSGFAGTSAEVTGDISADEGQPATAYPEYAPGTRPAQERPAAQAAAKGKTEEAATAAGVLAMAQQLHDQYVAEGQQTRAEYITEGEETRAKYITEGEETRAQYIAEGQATRDEYIAEGESTREQYVAEAERRRDDMISEAETRAENMIEEAELTSTRTLNALERRKTDLEAKVGELTHFERDYRARLKDYIEGQLNELTSRGSIEKEATGA